MPELSKIMTELNGLRSNPHLRYFEYVAKHKIFVFLAGYAFGLGLKQLLTHDWSKFLLDEWNPYVEYFYGEKQPDTSGTGYMHKPGVNEAFDTAWNHHQKRQPHHWQYWLLMLDSGSTERWTLQQHNPPMGEVYLAKDGKPVAVFEDEIMTGKANHGINDYALNMAEEVKNSLNQKKPKALPMPVKYVLEMVADWRGAGLAQGKPDLKGWYAANKDKMILHPKTRLLVEALLEQIQ